MASQLFATKSIDVLCAQEATGNELRRTLTATQLTLLGIGGIIGTGIFVLTGTAAAHQAGPALALSFVLAGIGCTFAGLCYAEFASMIPVSGSAYSYSYATLGEGIAWFIGWNLVLEYLFAVATVSVGWSGYVVSFCTEQLGIHIPSALSNAPFDSVGDTVHIVRTGAIINLPAVLIVGLLTVICYIGIKQSATFNSFIVAIKVTVILLFILFGASYINTANWHPYIPPNTGQWGTYGISGILAASGIIFFAYIGFDAISTAAQETKNPQRDMPIGMLSSLIICTVLYVIVASVLTGMVNYKDLGVSAPVALAVDRYPAAALVGVARQDRCNRGHHLGNARHDSRAGSHLLCDGARRAAAANLRTRSSQVPHALGGHAGDRSQCTDHRRPLPGQPAGQGCIHRHAVRLCNGVHRGTDTAAHAP